MYVYVGLAERVGDPLVRPRAKIRRPSVFLVAGDRSFCGEEQVLVRVTWAIAGVNFFLHFSKDLELERVGLPSDNIRFTLPSEKVDLSLRKALP